MSSDDSTEMIWEPMWVGRPPGTHFSLDGSSPLARADDTNRLDTHATLGQRIEKDDPNGEGQDLAEVAAAIGAAVLLGCVAMAVPQAANWWQSLRTKWDSRSSSMQADAQVKTSQMAIQGSAEFAAEVEIAIGEHRTRMSSAEAQKRIVSVLMAAAFIADQMRDLANADIDHDASRELQTTMERLTVPELTDSLNRMLETDSFHLDDGISAELMRVFGGGRMVEGRFVPLKNAQVKNAPRISHIA